MNIVIDNSINHGINQGINHSINTDMTQSDMHTQSYVPRDAGTTGAAGASAPLAFCIFNFVGAERVQTMGATGAQNFYNRQN